MTIDNFKNRLKNAPNSIGLTHAGGGKNLLYRTL